MQQPMYQSTPQEVRTQSANIIQIKLDKEALDLFNNCHDELKNSLINVALKAFKEDPMYLKYFVDKSKMPESVINEIEENVVQPQQQQVQQIQQPMTQTVQPTQQTQSAPAVSFDSW